MTKRKTKKWKQSKYLQACRILDEINRRGNFCNVRKINGRITCNGKFKHREDLCCMKCSHLTENECNTQSLACKISYCYIGLDPIDLKLCHSEYQYSIAEKRRKVVKIIKAFIKKHKIPYYSEYRMSMEDSFSIYYGEKSLDDYEFYPATFKNQTI